MEELSPKDRKLIETATPPGATVQSLAKLESDHHGGIRVALHRIPHDAFGVR